MNEEAVKQLVNAAVQRVLSEKSKTVFSAEIPIEVSGRHIHLSKADLEKLFGKNYSLKKKADLSQPGQFLCEERVVLAGPKGQLRQVAVLGPLRNQTQVELSLTDCRDLGIAPVIRMSGELDSASPVYIMNGMNSVYAKNAAIVAQNHVHMTPADAEKFEVSNGEEIQIRVQTERPITFERVVVRVSDQARLAMHIDYDEANACRCSSGAKGFLLGRSSQENQIKTATQEIKSFTIEEAHETVLSAEAVYTAAEAGKKVIYIKDKTIITPLAKDEAREKGIRLEFRSSEGEER